MFLVSALSFRMYDLPDWGIYDLGALIVFFMLIVFSEFKWLTHKKKIYGLGKLTEKQVPGPFSLPIIGTRWMYYGKYKMNKIHEAYKDLFKTYGPIVKEEALWNFPVISISSKEDIEKVLRFVSKYPLRPPTEVMAHYRASRPDRYTSLGITNEQGEEWHRLRSLLTPELTSTRTVNRFFPELNSVGDDFIRLLLASRDPDTETVNGFDELAGRVGLESTCSLILGKRLGFLENDIGPLAKKLAYAVKDQFCAYRDTFYGLPIWKIFVTSSYKKFICSEETIYDVISELVDAAEKQEEETFSMDAAQSVFMSILRAPGLDIRDKKAGIIDFIAAGIKTLGNTLVFLLYLIAKNKHCQEKLHDEIQRIMPNESNLDANALREAHYLRACILEAFRVLPTAPCVARVLETDMELSGYHLKSGSVVLCHTWIACLQESNFKNAETYMPERWLAADGTCSAQSHPFLVVPFGVGRRMCPGKRFVELELQVVLAQIVREFELDFDGVLGLDFEFLLTPTSPANFKLRKRN